MHKPILITRVIVIQIVCHIESEHVLYFTSK